MSAETLQLIISIGIKIAGYLIPALSGLVGGPLGWILSLLLSAFTDWLADRAEEALRLKAIKDKVHSQVMNLNQSAKTLFEVQKRLKAGENVPQKEQDEAKAELKKRAQELISFKPDRAKRNTFT